MENITMSIFGEHNDDLSLDDLVPPKTQILCGLRRPRTPNPFEQQLMSALQRYWTEKEREARGTQPQKEVEPPVDKEEAQD